MSNTMIGTAPGDVALKNPLQTLIIVGAIAWGGYELLKPKKKSVGKIDTTQLLLLAGAGVGAYLLFKPKQQQQQLPQQQLPVYQGGGYQQQQQQQGSNVWDAVSSLFGAAGQYLQNR